MPVQSHLHGLTTKQYEVVLASEPMKVSLNIGGREFPLSGVSLAADVSLHDALREQYDQLLEERLFDIQEIATRLGISAEEARNTIVTQLLFLEQFMQQTF